MAVVHGASGGAGHGGAATSCREGTVDRWRRAAAWRGGLAGWWAGVHGGGSGVGGCMVG